MQLRVVNIQDTTDTLQTEGQGRTKSYEEGLTGQDHIRRGKPEGNYIRLNKMKGDYNRQARMERNPIYEGRAGWDHTGLGEQDGNRPNRP